MQPTLALIADRKISIDTTLGDVIVFKPIPNIPTGQQARMIRMLLPQLLTQYVLDWHKKTHGCIFLEQDYHYIISHRIEHRNYCPKIDLCDLSRIKKGWYHDSHMRRPFSEHRDAILKLAKALGIVY